MLIGRYVENFRISNYRWVYTYGKLVSGLMVFGSIIWSAIHPIFVLNFKKNKTRKTFIWTAVGMIPFIYFITMMVFVMIKIDDKIT